MSKVGSTFADVGAPARRALGLDPDGADDAGASITRTLGTRSESPARLDFVQRWSADLESARVFPNHLEAKPSPQSLGYQPPVPGTPGPMAPSVHPARTTPRRKEPRLVELRYPGEWTALEREEVRARLKLESSPRDVPCDCNPCNLLVFKSVKNLETGNERLTVTFLCDDCGELREARRWPGLLEAVRGLRLLSTPDDEDLD